MDNLQFTARQYKHLNYIKKYPKLGSIKEKCKLKDYQDLYSLFDGRDLFERSDENYNDNTKFYLKSSVRAVLDEYNRQNRRFWIPVIISIIALVLSISSISIDIVKLLSQEDKQPQILPTAPTSTSHNKASSFPFPPVATNN